MTLSDDATPVTSGDPSSAVPDEVIDAVIAGVDSGGLELLGPDGLLAGQPRQQGSSGRPQHGNARSSRAIVDGLDVLAAKASDSPGQDSGRAVLQARSRRGVVTLKRRSRRCYPCGRNFCRGRLREVVSWPGALRYGPCRR